VTATIDISDSIAYRIYRAQRLLRRHLFHLVAKAGEELTPEQWFVLNKLRLDDGQAQVELGAAIFADRPNITRIVTGLERRGLIDRRRDPSDGRRMLVHLTPEGRSVHDRVADVVPAARDALFAGIPEDEMATAAAVLGRIEANILADSDPTD